MITLSTLKIYLSHTYKYNYTFINIAVKKVKITCNVWVILNMFIHVDINYIFNIIWYTIFIMVKMPR